MTQGATARRPALRRAALGVLIAVPIAWFGGGFYLSRMHDRIQSAIIEGKASEVQSEARWVLALSWICPSSFRPFESTSDSHVALGLGALEQDDVAAAREHLLDAVRTSSAPRLNPLGVCMLLVRALLARGERDVVLAYFDACRASSPLKQSDLERWSQAVREGRPPDFGPTLLH